MAQASFRPFGTCDRGIGRFFPREKRPGQKKNRFTIFNAAIPAAVPDVIPATIQAVIPTTVHATSSVISQTFIPAIITDVIPGGRLFADIAGLSRCVTAIRPGAGSVTSEYEDPQNPATRQR